MSTLVLAVWYLNKLKDVKNCPSKEFPYEEKGERDIRSNVPSRMKAKTLLFLI